MNQLKLTILLQKRNKKQSYKHIPIVKVFYDPNTPQGYTESLLLPDAVTAINYYDNSLSVY